MIVKAYICEICGLLFRLEKEDSFNEHVKDCSREKVLEAVNKLFFDKVLREDGWKEKKREEIDSDCSDPGDYEFFPKVTKISEISKIKKFVQTVERTITEEITYVKEN